MLTLKTLPMLGDDVSVDLGDDVSVDDGTDPSTIEQLTDFANSSAGSNIIANVLNMTSKATTGQPAVFVNKAGQVSTPTTAVNPQILIFGAVALGLLLYFNKKG